MKKLGSSKYFFALCFVFVLLNVSLFALILSKNIKATPPHSQNTKIFPEVQELKKRVYSFKELTMFFTTIANKQGAPYAFDLLKVAPLPPNTDLHLLGHAVGDILYKQQGVQGIKVCTNDFRNACSHSIVVALFLKDGEKAIDTISKVCQNAPGGKGAYTMCFHGLGHGVLAYTGYEIEKAVPLCKKTGTIARNNREYIECVGGMTMEMISGVHDPSLRVKQSSKYFKDDDPLSPCNTAVIPTGAKDICYVYLTPHLFESAGADLGRPVEKDFQKAFSYCDSLTEKSERHACFNGFGKEFVVLVKNRDIRDIANMTDGQLKQVYSWCMLSYAADGQQSCIESAVNSLYWGGENDRTASIKFCEAIPNTENQGFCMTSLMNAVSYYVDDRNYRASFCNELPKGFMNDCQKTLRI